MQQIDLQAIPSQSFSIHLDSDYYNITIRLCVNIMALDIARNNVVLLTGARIVPGTFLIPYRYLSSGNFLITTMNGDYPDYMQFGVTQFLVYASQAELEALNAGT